MAGMNAYFISYQKSASSIISSFRGDESFSVNIKKYFKQHPKHGSRDRKNIADLCFGFLRIGKSADSYTTDDQMLIGFFLTHQNDIGYLESIKPDWLAQISEGIQEKLNFIVSIFPAFNPSLIFPFTAEKSGEINQDELIQSFFAKPSFYIRIRPGRKGNVLAGLTKAQITYDEISEDCLRIVGNTNIEAVGILNRDYVVQDMSSQKTASSFPFLSKEKLQIWDACAASGGKAIMLYDHFPHAQLYVSDVRTSILEILKDRLKQAGIRAANIFQADLEDAYNDHIIKKSIPKQGFDLILADVPCSGSGTWGRNPEGLRFFNERELQVLHKKQLNIVKRLVPYLKPGGHLVYITCSIFKVENEKVVEDLLACSALELVSQQLISGLNEGADSLFTALFTLKP
jgi:16S rRNA (cytosine967-C5)-methyltransferase